MIFWTIVFIIYYLASLIRGNLYYDSIKKSGELVLKQATTDSRLEKEKIAKDIVKSSWDILLSLLLIIIMYIYLFNAINVDVYKYPSIVMLFYSLLTVFVFRDRKKSRQDLTTEDGRYEYRKELDNLKRYSFKDFIKQLIFLIYFGYMFYILVLL